MVVQGHLLFSTSTEEYDGSSWTGGGALPTAIRSNRGLGTQTAGLNLAGEAAPGKEMQQIITMAHLGHQEEL